MKCRAAILRGVGNELVTRRYRLDRINDAITDMREGRNIRCLVEFT